MLAYDESVELNERRWRAERRSHRNAKGLEADSILRLNTEFVASALRNLEQLMGVNFKQHSSEKRIEPP